MRSCSTGNKLDISDDQEKQIVFTKNSKMKETEMACVKGNFQSFLKKSF